MHSILRVMAIAMAAALLTTSAAIAQPGNGNNGNDKPNGNGDRTSQVEDADECYFDDGELAGTAAFAGTSDLWPPNHKYHDASASWATVDPDDTFMGTYDATHNQFDEDGNEFNGAGNTDDDIIDDAENSGVLNSEMYGNPQEVNYQVRAERSGRDQDGRTYSITGDWTITDNDSMRQATCDFEFHIYVPHDQGKRNNGDADPDQDGPAPDASLFSAMMVAL